VKASRVMFTAAIVVSLSAFFSHAASAQITSLLTPRNDAAVVVRDHAAHAEVVRVEAHAASAQTTYPLTCRGGGTLIIANDADNGVRITYERAPGATPDGLKSGQCSWADRSVGANEPNTICDSDRQRASTYTGTLVTNGTVIFHVYNDGKGCMKVMKTGF